MATDHNTHDPLRNPQVDYDRSDLSPKGILMFLIGLFIVGFFIELVIWGMFRFMARSEVLFAHSQQSPMAASVPKAAPTQGAESVFQNTPGVNLGNFPEPRLQTNDAGDMTQISAVGEHPAGCAAVHRSAGQCAYSDLDGDAVDRAARLADAAQRSAAGLE